MVRSMEYTFDSSLILAASRIQPNSRSASNGVIDPYSRMYIRILSDCVIPFLGISIPPFGAYPFVSTPFRCCSVMSQHFPSQSLRFRAPPLPLSSMQNQTPPFPISSVQPVQFQRSSLLFYSWLFYFCAKLRTSISDLFRSRRCSSDAFRFFSILYVSIAFQSIAYQFPCASGLIASHPTRLRSMHLFALPTHSLSYLFQSDSPKIAPVPLRFLQYCSHPLHSGWFSLRRDSDQGHHIIIQAYYRRSSFRLHRTLHTRNVPCRNSSTDRTLEEIRIRDIRGSSFRDQEEASE